MAANGIYGLSGSGLDIESLVKVGMMSKQKQYDNMYRAEMKNEWKKTAMNEVYSKLQTFSLSGLTDYKLQSTLNAMSAKSSDESVVTVTANGAAAMTTHRVEVSRLASNASLLSNGTLDRANTSKPKSIELRDFLYASSDSFKMTPAEAASVSPPLDPSKTWYNVGTTATPNYKAGTDVALSFTLYDTANGAAGTDDTHKFTVSFTYDEILEKKQTLNDLAQKIKDATSAGLVSGTDANNKNSVNIYAGYDSTTDSFNMYNKSGGADNVIAFDISTGVTSEEKENAAKLLNALKLASYDTATNSLTNISTFDPTAAVPVTAQSFGGSAGQATIDGKVYTLDSNRVVVAGVQYNFQNTTDVGKSVRVSVSQDTDAVVAKAKKFVEDYNKIIDELNEKYREKVEKDYGPLTDAQKKDMTEEQIEKWEKKAKAGLLYHDTTIGKIISDMRSAISTPIDSISGKYNSAYQIGIETETDQGHLKLDEDKLRKALQADPEAVYKVLAKTDEDDKSSSKGIAHRLSDVLRSGLKAMSNVAGTSAAADDDSTLGALIKMQKERMATFKDMLTAFEKALYKKYDAMEVTLQQMNSLYNGLFSS
ncbi:hypothetical protein TAMA11512_22310 [Selenomonas sp. TAMA-11512]|uniref:flagellar filament capping protein FliD n=1 Tax=Selenomonas sp. TAMA-11512 TaxID=3095337 RepID=UPI0030874BF1|nr:hypothetical protein TAMA11512_22310 [Selenomonas sp. TAMA-11512]